MRLPSKKQEDKMRPRLTANSWHFRNARVLNGNTEPSVHLLQAKQGFTVRKCKQINGYSAGR